MPFLTHLPNEICELNILYLRSFHQLGFPPTLSARVLPSNFILIWVIKISPAFLAEEMELGRVTQNRIHWQIVIGVKVNTGVGGGLVRGGVSIVQIQEEGEARRGTSWSGFPRRCGERSVEGGRVPSRRGVPAPWAMLEMRRGPVFVVTVAGRGSHGPGHAWGRSEPWEGWRVTLRC